MSTCKIYGIYDKDLGLVAVQREENDALAIRNFTDGCNEKGTYLNKHPENYTLYRICVVDQITGKMLDSECLPMLKAEECIIKSEPKS